MENTIMSNDEDSNEHFKTTKSKFIIQSDEKKLLLPTSKASGLTWRLAVLFITGEILGSGVVAIGNALVNTGLYGLFLIVIGIFCVTFSANILSELCIIISSKEQSTTICRNPYTFIIESTLGRPMKITASVLLNLLTLSCCTVYLLLSTEYFSIVVHAVITAGATKYEFRILLVVFAFILMPFTLLGTPKEFWGVALFAALTTIVGSFITMILLWINSSKNSVTVPQREVTTYTFFYGLGTILFAMLGLPFFPNIQVDLIDKNKFSKAINIGYLIIMIIYLPISLTGYTTLGGNIKENVVYNLFLLEIIKSHGEYYMVYKVLSYIALALFSGHFIFAYVLLFNSSAQEVEHYLKVPTGFCWQRCVIRFSLVLLTLTLAQVIPNFNIILSFTGGTFQTILGIQLPALAYLKIKDNIPWYKKLLLIVLFITGFVLIIGSVYTAVINVSRIYS